MVKGWACAQGSGRQQKGALINLVAFYIFALPLALFLAFYVRWGVVGLFAGMGLGPLVQTLLYGWLVLRTGALQEHHLENSLNICIVALPLSMCAAAWLGCLLGWAPCADAALWPAGPEDRCTAGVPARGHTPLPMPMS